MRRWLPVLIVCAVLGTALPASAQSELDVARENAEAAARAADAARDAADEARTRADALAAELGAALDLVLDVEMRLDIVALRAEVARRERDALRDQVAALMVQRYVFVERAADFGDERGPSVQARADALAQFASFGIGNEVERYRVVQDDLVAAEAELSILRDERETAVATLERNDALLTAEIEEMVRQLDIAEESEAEFFREVSRLAEEERLRLEAERRAAAEVRRKAAEEVRRAAEAEVDRQRAEAERRAAEEAANRPSTTTTTVPSTTGPPTSDPATPTTSTAAPPSTEPPAPDIRGSGDFICPIGGPTSFFDTWGAARSGGRSHKGVDMFAQRGTPVVAPVSGVVRHSSSSRLAGLSFYLDGDDGNLYFGAHLDSFGSSGRVAAGAVVGTVGNTGNARFSSPHLHFEIKPGGGRSINPTAIVRAACG